MFWDKQETIKQNINNDIGLGEMIEMYEELANYKQLLSVYFDNKKMEIINM
jgi:hypothetical protein